VAALQPGQPGEPVGAFTTEGRNTGAGKDDIHEPVKAPDIVNKLKVLFPEMNKYPGKGFCFAYANANSEWYETRQSIWFSSAPELSGIQGIIIRFDSAKKSVRKMMRAARTRGIIQPDPNTPAI
jgi:hypothetical protein